MRSYILSNQAKRDLASIWGYTYKTWSEHQADKYIDTLFSYFKLLLEQPQIGKSLHSSKHYLSQFLAESHLVFYRTRIDGIEIVRVLHKSTDYLSHIDLS